MGFGTNGGFDGGRFWSLLVAFTRSSGSTGVVLRGFDFSFRAGVFVVRLVWAVEFILGGVSRSRSL